MSAPTKVLFLCTGNSARSQMAEALLRMHAGDRYEAYSAGLEPEGMNPYTVRVMDEIGVDVSGQRSKSVREYMGRLHWSFDDPAAAAGTDEEKLQKFRDIRDQIDRRIQAWLAEQGVVAGVARA